MINHFLLAILFLTTLSVPNMLAIAEEDVSIEGTYVLESRMLSNGEVIKPPEIIGIYNVANGYTNLNIMQRSTENKVKNVSLIAKYKLSSTEFYEERLFVMINNEIDNKEIMYGFQKSGSSPVKIADGKIEFTYPINNDVHASFEGNNFTATRVDGSYIDYWKKFK